MSTYKSTLIKVFCLEGLFLDKVIISKKIINLHTRSPRLTAICPNCESSTNRIHRYAHRTVKHMTCDDKIVQLQLTIRNFKCRKCGYIFREPMCGIDRRKTTEHYRKSIIPKVKDRSFSSVANEYNISTSSLINSTTDLMHNVGIAWPNKYFALGIDEHSFSKHDYLMTITNLSDHRLLSILHNDKQSTLRSFIRNIPNNTQKRVYCVCIDMNQKSKAFIEQELPNTPIVIDKFHVIQFCNHSLQYMRSVFTSCEIPLPKKLLEINKENLTDYEKGMLKEVFKRYPTIEDLWRIKEFIRTMYRIKNAKKAKERFQTLLYGLNTDQRALFKTMYQTFKRWKPYILNYFDHRITNVYTEGVHTRIKLLKRISYDFRNKTNYIAKMTLAFLPLTILLNLLTRHPV